MAADSLHLPKLAQITCVTLGRLGRNSNNGIRFAKHFVRETSAKENGERARAGERLKEPSDHDAGLILGEKEGRKEGRVHPCSSRRVGQGHQGVLKPTQGTVHLRNVPSPRYEPTLVSLPRLARSVIG